MWPRPGNNQLLKEMQHHAAVSTCHVATSMVWSRHSCVVYSVHVCQAKSNTLNKSWKRRHFRLLPALPHLDTPRTRTARSQLANGKVDAAIKATALNDTSSHLEAHQDDEAGPSVALWRCASRLSYFEIAEAGSVFVECVFLVPSAVACCLNHHVTAPSRDEQ